jgi:hypothetical protein
MTGCTCAETGHVRSHASDRSDAAMCHYFWREPLAPNGYPTHVLTLHWPDVPSWMTEHAPARVWSWSKTTLRAPDASVHTWLDAPPQPLVRVFCAIPWIVAWSLGRASVRSQPASCLHLRSLDRMRPIILDPAFGYLDHLFHSLHTVHPFNRSTKQAWSHTLPLFGLECMQCLSILPFSKCMQWERSWAHTSLPLSLQCMCALLHSL